MAKRMIITLAAVAAFLTAIGFIKFRQIQTAIAQASSFQPPPEAVTTVVTRQERWASTLSAIGTTAAVHGVTVSADLPGVVEAISFDSGRAVQAGDVLVRLDTRQEQAQLAARACTGKRQAQPTTIHGHHRPRGGLAGAARRNRSHIDGRSRTLEIESTAGTSIR